MTSRQLTIISTLLFTLFTLTGVDGQGDLESINRILDEFQQNDQFSGVVLLADKGKVTLERAIGRADRSTHTPMTGVTPFRIASITKSFTALLIMQLYEAGKLKLEQSVAELLPELPLNHYRKVQVKNLLNHTSGLPNEPDSFYAQKLSPREIIQRLTAGKRPKRPAGKTFNYNNVDYLLLGLIIEKFYGAPWKEVVQERILDPLEMTETGFLEKEQRPAGLAKGYLCKGGNCKEEPDYYIENFYAAGNMYATATDLLKWDQGLYGEHLLSQEAKALMYTSDPNLGYVAYGSWTFQHPFLPGYPFTVERRGGILGFNSVLMRFPEAEKTLIILSNTDQFNPDTFGDQSNLKEQILQRMFAGDTSDQRN